METWQKIAIGSAVVLSCGAIGYAVYKTQQKPVLCEVEQKREEDVHVIRATSLKHSEIHSSILNSCGDSSDASDSVVETSKEIDVIQIMDEVLVDSLDHIIRCSKVADTIPKERMEERKEFANQLRKQSNFIFELLLVSQIFLKIENTICQHYNVNVQDYYSLVKFKEDAKDE